MARSIQSLLFCKHCEIYGHDVVHCHRLFEDLTSFATTNGIVTGHPTQGLTSIMQTHCHVARWGKKRKSSKYASLTTTSRFLGGGSGTSSTPSASLTPIEGQALANYLEQHRRHWLWSRHVEHQWRYAGPFPINAERHNPKV